jgi:hypothetical protein
VAAGDITSRSRPRHVVLVRHPRKFRGGNVDPPSHWTAGYTLYLADVISPGLVSIRIVTTLRLLAILSVWQVVLKPRL